MDKQIEYLAKLDQEGGVEAVINYLRTNLVPHVLTIQTFNGNGSTFKVARSTWIAKASSNEFRGEYTDNVTRTNTGLSITRLRAYSIVL